MAHVGYFTVGSNSLEPAKVFYGSLLRRDRHAPGV